MEIVYHIWGLWGRQNTAVWGSYLAGYCSPRQWRRSRLSSCLRNHWPEPPAAWRPGPAPTGAGPSWRRSSISPGPSCWSCPPSRSGRHRSRWCILSSPCWDWRNAGPASPGPGCSPRSTNIYMNTFLMYWGDKIFLSEIEIFLCEISKYFCVWDQSSACRIILTTNKSLQRSFTREKYQFVVMFGLTR